MTGTIVPSTESETMNHIVPHRTEPEASFGSFVRSMAGTPTTSEGKDYKFWSDIARYTIDGETEVGICTVYAQPGVPVAELERHLHTPELLIPIDAPFVVPLMREGDPAPMAFRVDIGEAIVINTAVWHGASQPVGVKESSYFVIFRRGTPHDDVQKKRVDPFVLEVG
jgi:hypothetical protein